MSSSLNRVLRLFAILCAFTLVAAACGDDDDTSTETPAADDSADEAADGTADEAADGTADEAADGTADEAADGTADEAADGTADEAADGEMMEATGTPIKIAAVYSETGRTGLTYQTTDDVAMAWAEWKNAHGGVNGHPVEIIAADSESTGEGAAAAAREAVEGEGAVAVIINDTTAENAIAEYLVEQNVPAIGATANGRPSDSGDAHWPNIYFTVAPSNPATAASTMVAAAAIGATNYSAAVCAEVPACAEAGGLYGVVGPIVGIEYAGLVTVGAADPSYTAPCLELIGLETDFINLGLAPQTATAVIEECSLQGYEGVYGAANNSVVESDLDAIDGLHMAGGLNGFPWWADAAPVQEFRDAMEAYDADLDYRNPSATLTWTSLQMFAKAMENGPAADAEVTSADVIAAYQQVSGETLEGLAPAPLTYNADSFQPLISCFWGYEYQDGEFSTLAPVSGESGNGVDGDLATTCFTLG